MDDSVGSGDADSDGTGIGEAALISILLEPLPLLFVTLVLETVEDFVVPLFSEVGICFGWLCSARTYNPVFRSSIESLTITYFICICLLTPPHLDFGSALMHKCCFQERRVG